jgi:Ca2+-dependent lipid-binding protein
LHAADRAGKTTSSYGLNGSNFMLGKSDPYVVFTFNGDKVYKSQTKKKTLHPEWNETFTVQVPSRVGSEFQLEVFDWNQIEQAKSLGTANVELAGLDPFQGVEREVQLTHTKHGEKGAIRLMLTFQPEIIAKSRRNTSTFASAGRAMTQVGHLPFDGAKGVVQGVGSAGSKVTSLFKRDKDKPPSIEEEVPPAGAASKSVDEPHSFPTQMPLSPTSPIEPGIVKVTILNAKDLSYGSSDPKDIKPYVQLRLGEKDYKTKNAKAVDPEW